MNRWIRWLAALSAVTLMAACGSDDDPQPPGTIATVAQQQGFTALLAAANKAGLSATLDGTTKLTVFAPTDAAFNALAGRLGFANATALVTALTPAQLSTILSYHVLGSEVRKVNVPVGADITTLETGLFKVKTVGADLFITDELLRDSRITATDVVASNGVIHVVDTVLLPEGLLNIVQTAQANPVFSSLVSAVIRADLAGTLSGAGPLTVFAPTDPAFAAIASVAADLTVPQLTTVLTYHVVAGKVLAADIPLGAPIPTVAGQSITINAGTPPTISDITDATANIVATDIETSNGVIHVIDKVLIPAL